MLALSKELRWDKKGMDKIWYENPLKSEIIGRSGGDGKKRMTMQNRQKSNVKNCL